MIHNGKIDRMTNYSKGNIKAIVEVGIAYEEDINNALETLKVLSQDLFNQRNDLFFEVPVVLGVMDLGDSAINIRIICNTDANGKFEAERLLRKRIKDEFDQKGIEIPYNKTVVLTNTNEE